MTNNVSVLMIALCSFRPCAARRCYVATKLWLWLSRWQHFLRRVFSLWEDCDFLLK